MIGGIYMAGKFENFKTEKRIHISSIVLPILGAMLLCFSILIYRGSLKTPSAPEPVLSGQPIEQPTELSAVEQESAAPRPLDVELIESPVSELSEPEAVPAASSVRLMAVGDDLIHNTVYWSAELDDGSYDFTPFYETFSEITAQYDLCCVNQETILVNDPALYDNYPHFGTPTAVGDALVKAGFNVIEGATNHCYDKLDTGVLNTVGFWRDEHPGVVLLGLHDSQEDADTIRVLNRNGIRIALLNYTYGLNGQYPGKTYMIDILNEEKCAADIESARSLADFVIVFVHWGTEDSFLPDEQQKTWARFFADHDVDAVIGAHPHRVQPMEVYVNASGKSMPVYYSLGNFLSHQMSAEAMLGAMASITMVKDETGTYLSNFELLPTVNYLSHNNERGLWNYEPMLLSDYTEEMAANHRFPETTVAYMHELFEKAATLQN